MSLNCTSQSHRFDQCSVLVSRLGYGNKVERHGDVPVRGKLDLMIGGSRNVTLLTWIHVLQ